MGLTLLSFIQNHFHFPPRKLNDLQLSDKLVNRLPIPEHTKKFVYAVLEPESQSIIYILSAQNLSKQSSLDTQLLIKSVKPDIVLTQLSPSSLSEIQSQQEINNKSNNDAVPTTSLGVLKGCFVDKNDKDKYESLAGSVLLKEIFGVGFYGHFFAAKKAAAEVGSSLYYIESQSVDNSCADESNSSGEVNKSNNKFEARSLVSGNLGSGISSKRLYSTSDLHSDTIKSFVSSLSQLSQKASVSDSGVGDCCLSQDYQVPGFAQTVYPLLMDLHSVFGELPVVNRALVHAQKMLCSVDKGEPVSLQVLSEVQTFQIAVEGLRVGLNSAGRCPIKKDEKKASNSNFGFSELSTEDKSHALFAHAIRSQTKKCKSVVAIVDAGSLSGIRKYWNTPLPAEVKDLIEQSITKYEGEEEMSSDKKRLIPDKPVVAVGAGATAILGASSLSKAVPASTFIKLITFKIPASLKISLVQNHNALAMAFSKVLGPSKVVAPGFVTSGAKSTSVVKAAASTKNVGAVTHSVRAYIQRTSFSAMRTAFYEIMRKRRFQPVGYTPWIKFGCSVSACTGLLVYGDGIECAVESLPVAPAIASLGRGLQSLHQANQVIMQTNNTKLQEAVQTLLYRLRNNKQ